MSTTPEAINQEIMNQEVSLKMTLQEALVVTDLISNLPYKQSKSLIESLSIQLGPIINKANDKLRKTTPEDASETKTKLKKATA